MTEQGSIYAPAELISGWAWGIHAARERDKSAGGSYAGENVY
ncbi:hypothetical protein FHS16_000850 [Paenibacillus endophyticus]|uniref:Uncharacterized protein n=1 Tax=Paenibacillus endophyticus TaxID=1294268 RepID=A0A7W5C485_9BACL|nr:hypothetical protein [Paenibacillus endophyticus]MBB3150816.1 hypothetical protein [Paenibacillus endophyticus]